MYDRAQKSYLRTGCYASDSARKTLNDFKYGEYKTNINCNTLNFKRLDPNSRKTGTAPNAALPLVTRHIQSGE